MANRGPPQIIDDQAMWVEPKTDAVIAAIGELCQAPGAPLTTGARFVSHTELECD
jgi:hypothetical protein